MKKGRNRNKTGWQVDNGKKNFMYIKLQREHINSKKTIATSYKASNNNTNSNKK